jgi:hypothetical protein
MLFERCHIFSDPDLTSQLRIRFRSNFLKTFLKVYFTIYLVSKSSYNIRKKLFSKMDSLKLKQSN